MRRFLLAGLLFACSIPALAAQRITVEELRQNLLALKAAKTSDGKMAQALRKLELSERLTEVTLQKLTAEAGPQTVQSLNLLADAAALLAPPADELPAKEAPNRKERQRILSAAVHYVATT